jgi:hypothetical protein
MATGLTYDHTIGLATGMTTGLIIDSDIGLNICAENKLNY